MSNSRRPRRRRPNKAEIWPLLGRPSGEVEDVPGLQGVARTGTEVRPPKPDELMPLPEDAQLQFLPARTALGRAPDGQTVQLDGLAVAVRLPVGYTRTLLPAFDRADDAEGYLPFFGYTAVFARGEELLCAAVKTESNRLWDPQAYHQEDLDDKIKALQAQFPENRVLHQLEVCAREYGCYNAQNIFMHRWEGAVTVSPACNAQCRGCISLQPDELPPSPQERFHFRPSLEEIVELGRHHLTSEHAMFSFGQGCEGEPLLAGDLIAEAVAELAPLESRGTIHLNSNASLPDKVAKIVEAGLDSLRVSTNSLLPHVYEAYYQPKRYKFEALRESTLLARQAGVYVSLNLLMMPGWIDVEEEVEALLKFVQECDVNMIQLRTLNIDPDLYAAHVPRPRGRTIGIPALLKRLEKDCPDLLLGNHSPQIRKGEVPFRTNVPLTQP